MTTHPILLTVLALVFTANLSEAATHSAAVNVFFYDPIDLQYSGNSNPFGPPWQIILKDGRPGYLNRISGGANGGASGYAFATHFPNTATTYLMGAAIRVTDTAGASHSLSAMNDPALNDIVADINALGNEVFFSIAVYPYNSPPSRYSSAEAVLSAGESANGGQPFDILVTATDKPTFGFTDYSLAIWDPYFTNEIGNLDGITAIKVTDLGLLPEPSGTAPLTLGTFAVLARRRRRAQL